MFLQYNENKNLELINIMHYSNYDYRAHIQRGFWGFKSNPPKIIFEYEPDDY